MSNPDKSNQIVDLQSVDNLIYSRRIIMNTSQSALLSERVPPPICGGLRMVAGLLTDESATRCNQAVLSGLTDFNYRC